MLSNLVITFIADDKPGLIGSIAQTVASHAGNWEESRMSHLAGKFAGIIRVSVSSSAVDALKAELRELTSKGLTVIVETGIETASDQTNRHYELNLIGLDRPGIVKEFSQALSSHAINVTQMSSNISSAPMTGEALFEARAIIDIPETLDLLQLRDQLDSIANQLTVDISLEPLDQSLLAEL